MPNIFFRVSLLSLDLNSLIKKLSTLLLEAKNTEFI